VLPRSLSLSLVAVGLQLLCQIVASSRKIIATCVLRCRRVMLASFFEKMARKTKRSRHLSAPNTHAHRALLSFNFFLPNIFQECNIILLFPYHTHEPILPPFYLARANDATADTTAIILNPDTAHFCCCPTDQQLSKNGSVLLRERHEQQQQSTQQHQSSIARLVDTFCVICRRHGFCFRLLLLEVWRRTNVLL